MTRHLVPLRVNPLITAALILAGAGISHSQPATGADTPGNMPTLQTAAIHVNGDTLYYDGDISQSSWQALSELAESGATQGVTRMVITSPGGDTIAGRAIGRWVHSNISLLEVEGMCFSSCANYVFPAAPRVIIREGGIIGWHGTERTAEILALSQPGVTADQAERTELRAALLLSAPALEGTEELEITIEAEMERAASARVDEAAFFADLGIGDELALYGLFPEHLPVYEASAMPGWTYSLEDMACFGVTNVEYAGSGAYQDSDAVRAHVHVFNLTDECEPSGSQFQTTN